VKHTFFLLVPLLSFSLFGSKATPLFDLNSIRDASTLDTEILSDRQSAKQDAWEKTPLHSIGEGYNATIWLFPKSLNDDAANKMLSRPIRGGWKLR
jgi:hypothetical protein